MALAFGIGVPGLRGDDAKTIGGGVWYQADRYAWAIQKVEPALRKQRSSPWRPLVIEGRNVPIKWDWNLLLPSVNWNRAEVLLASGVNEPPFLRAVFEDPNQKADLPDLPRGEYWLTLKAFNGKLVDYRRFYLNVLESSVRQTDRLAPEAGRFQAAVSGSSIHVSGWHERGLCSPVLRLEICSMTGDLISCDETPLSGSEDSVLLPVVLAKPGMTFLVRAQLLENASVLDQTELWMSLPGEYPARPVYGGKAVGKLSVFSYPGGETLSTAEPFETQKAGIEAQIAGMAARGSQTIALMVRWGSIEPVCGACDWTNLDAYVGFLTEKKIPFVLTGMDGVGFGISPVEIWGKWMMNHTGEYHLWRNTPVTSPASDAYFLGATKFVQKTIERYRGNPYLAGYCSLNQNIDSGIFLDHYDSVTDYSYVARESFRHFLRHRYIDLKALNRAWNCQWISWDEIQPPLPQLDQLVNLTPAWRDWTDWKLDIYRKVTTGLLDPLVANLDPGRAVIHYTAKTGPFEFLLKDVRSAAWGNADGAGEDYRMGRINAITKNWGVWRQTESHDVPPANRRYMMDLFGQALRGGGEKIRYNLVFNTLPNLFLSEYPKNEKLKDTMEWWSMTRESREMLAGSTVGPVNMGAILSWGDMLYRIRAWRWYAMPGDRADAMLRGWGFLPVRWVSEWSPDSSWKGLKTILLPDDAQVLSALLTDRLSKFVAEGGHLVVWGDAGRYGFGEPEYAWPAKLGCMGLKLESLPQKLVFSSELRKMPSASVRAVVVPDTVRVTRDSAGQPRVLEWQWGKGAVQWCLSSIPGESERVVAGALEKAGCRREVQSDDLAVDGYLIKKGRRTFLVVNRFLGFGVQAAETSMNTTFRLSELYRSARLKPLWGNEVEVNSEGVISVPVGPSEVRIFEVVK